MATGPFLSDRAEAARLELASGELPPPVFETGSSSSRLTSVCYLFRPQFGGRGSVRFVQGCGGRNRTCEGAINSRPTVPARKHHNESARLGSNQHLRAPKARGIPISPTRRKVPAHGVCRLLRSAQRESNPHFRHGKAAGCRYIMGAKKRANLSKNKLARAP